MKIKQIMLKNFANVNQIEINLSDSVTYLIGENGSGKTTVGLNAIWFILEGLSLKGKKVLHGDRFRFIGNHGKSAIGKLVLHDEAENIDITIQRKLLKNKTELKIVASDKRHLPADFIDDIFNIFSINPVGFAKLPPKEQAEALGVDTSENDKQQKKVYDERTLLGHDVKRLKGALAEMESVEEVESIDLKTLLKKKEQIENANTKKIEKAQNEKDKKVREAVEFNKEQDKKQTTKAEVSRNIRTSKDSIETLKEHIKRLEQQLVNDKEGYDRLIQGFKKLPNPLERKPIDIPLINTNLEDTSALTQQIESAEAINQKANLFQRFLEAEKGHQDALALYEGKTAELKKIEVNRVDYLKSCNLPFSNITIDDNGGVLINDRPFSETYFSKGEILRMGIKLAAAANPKLKYVFIPDSQSIDEKNREKLFDELTEAGFQVVAEYVDTEKQKDHGSILLKESKIVESYEKENELNEL